MLITKEALKESYLMYSDSIQGSNNNYQWAWTFFLFVIAGSLITFLIITYITDSLRVFVFGSILVLAIVLSALMIAVKLSSYDDKKEILKTGVIIEQVVVDENGNNFNVLLFKH